MNVAIKLNASEVKFDIPDDVFKTWKDATGEKKESFSQNMMKMYFEPALAVLYDSL